MVLGPCSECGRERSDRAVACPHCGAPVATQAEGQPIVTKMVMTQVESGKTLKEIRRQAVWGFTVSILGIFCFGLILEPFALYRGTKALRLIGESGLGTEYRTHARAAQVISVVMFFLWALLLAVAILGHGS